MADQNTPTGGRPGRPFVPPFRGPSNADGAGAGGDRTAAPERTHPRPFMPPGSLGAGAPAVPAPPLAPSPLTPPAPPEPPSHSPRPSPPRPPAVADSEPLEPGPEPAEAMTPVAPRPKSPVRAEAVVSTEFGEGSRDLAHELAEELAEELAVEHAISETLGQGSATATESFELERASEESPDALPELPSLPETAEAAVEDVPSGGPELSFFLPPDDMDAGPPAAHQWPSVDGVDATHEQTSAARESEPTSEASTMPKESFSEEAPSSSTPLPWLAAPTQSAEPADTTAPPAPDEATVSSAEQAMRYDAHAKPRDTPARRLGESPRDEATTIVGANLLVAEMLERVAHRVRSGELRVPALEESAGEAGALASVLAVLLGVRS